MTENAKPEPLGPGDLAGLNAAEALRHRAEEIFSAKAGQAPEGLDALSPEASRQLFHELRVHQIELEMQNEELRRARDEIEASRARYFDLYDLAPVGYLTLSELGLILEANLTAATLLGVVRGALVRQPLSHFVFREDQEVYYRHRKSLFETGIPQVCEVRLARSGGAHFWARLEATTAEDEEGPPVCRVVVSDITERKNAEAEQERLLAAEQEARTIAEQAVRAREAFLSIASHELKTPITSLRGYSQFVIRKHRTTGTLDPAQVIRALTAIDQQSRKLTNLIEQLLDISRIDAGKLALVREDASVSSVLGDALALIREVHPTRTFLVRDSASVRAYVDPSRFEQVMINLLDNAVKFSPKDSPVEIDVSPDARDEVVISVRDYGKGIAEKDRQRVFERFYQDSPGNYAGGMGLGLYISAQIVEMHGGTITYEAPEDGGSRFVVRLPLRASSPGSIP